MIDYYTATTGAKVRSCGGIKFASSLVEFRKLFLKDLTIALTLGGIAGAGWWNLYHLPQVQRRDAFYAKLEASKSQ
ncbi:hypothetical protein O0I10_003296 [Lichtheimia ornata]|uniref:Cytochrome c oxidase polypeptide VIIA n=1 Tax=Lichtheimia ornata TaxID=688661 RepID=A0AAD7Y1H6_9FUNG|nr:uncharacterized protein O0I10_003296 [Lichtheimia ornata]KAJ8661073.1 hypothetical protein O0I10_003296 [Lichtheimia ornata]